MSIQYFEQLPSNMAHRSKLMEVFATEASSLLTTGQDFCIARVLRDEDTKQHYIDFALFWSWSDQTQEIEKGFEDALYEEVELHGIGYYIFSTQCESEHIEEDDGVWRTDRWTMPNKFFKWCSLDEVDGNVECEICL
jgi:hypothetical protein